MSKGKHIFKYIILFLISSLISYYLTWTIDKITLETRLQFVFVFVYFLSVVFFLGLILIKHMPKLKLKKYIICLLISGVLAAAILISCFDFFMGLYKPMTINITAAGNNVELNEGQKGTEVWLNQVIVDNKRIDLSKVDLPENWEYRDGFLLSYKNQPSTLTFELPSPKNVKLKFLSHPWSGTVIVDNGYQTEQIDLFNPDEGGSYIDLSLEGVKEIITIREVLLIISCFVLLWSLCYFFLIPWSVIHRSKTHRFSLILMPVFLYTILFLLPSQVTFGVSTKLVIFLITVAMPLVLPNFITNASKSKLGNQILLVFVVLYSTFAFVGHQLFLSGSVLEVNILKLITFVLYLIFFTPYILNAIFLLQKYVNKTIKRTLPNHRECIIFRLCSGIIVFIISIIVTWPFFPGNITSDGVDIWAQAKGINDINDAHPVFYTLLTRMLLKVWDTPYTMIVFCSILFSFVISGILTLIYKKGYSSRILLIFSVIILILPNSYMMMSLISKNILFTAILLWYTYLIMKVFEEKETFFKKISNIVSMIICNILLNLIRHNGFVVFFVTGLFLLYCSVRIMKNRKIIPVAIFALIIMFNQLAKNAMYNSFDIIRSDMNFRGKNGPLLSPLGAALKIEKELPNETLELLEKIAPLQQWKDYYNPYLIDTFMFSTPTPQYQNVATRDAFKVYLHTLWQYPDIVIKDRLDNSNLVWNIVQPTNVNNSRYAVGIWPYPGATEKNMPQLLQADRKLSNGSYYKENPISKFLERIASASSKIEIIDIFIWRNGVYLVLSFILFVYLIMTNNEKYIFVFAPSLAVLFSYLIAIGWQIYQYLWFFPLNSVFSYIYTLADIRAKNGLINREDNKGQ